jgi:hypothetical protein
MKLYNMGEEEDYEDAKNGGNGNQRPIILQHIHPPNPIVFTDKFAEDLDGVDHAI